MRKSTIFFLSCLCFILGVAAHAWLAPEKAVAGTFYLYLIFLLLLVAGLADFIFYKNRRILAVFLGGSFFILGLWRFALAIPLEGEQSIAYYNEQEVNLAGTISDEPEVRDDNTRYTIDKLRNCEIGNCELSAVDDLQGRILLVMKNFPEFAYGDRIEFSCQLKQPEKVEDFDYPAYLSKEDIYSLCYYPKEIKKIASNQAGAVRSSLYFVKNKFAATVNRLLPEPQAAFLGGILYGARQSIPADLKEDFKRTGTTHLVAVSGYNISIVAGFIIAFLSYLWIPRRAAFPLAVVAIVAFVVLTGAGASVVRAGIMGLVVLLSKNVGRLSSARNVLALAATAMLLQNPKILALDLGFQLSFVSTIGLVVLSPYFSEKLKWVYSGFGLREAVSATFSALIFTLPLLLYNFGIFSLIAPVANILVVPFIPLTMSLGFVAGLLGLVSLPLGTVAGWLAWAPLTYEVSVIKFLARCPVVEWKIPLILFLLMYGVVICFAIWARKKMEMQNEECRM